MFPVQMQYYILQGNTPNYFAPQERSYGVVALPGNNKGQLGSFPRMRRDGVTLKFFVEFYSTLSLFFIKDDLLF